jgi:hypothetical protein
MALAISPCSLSFRGISAFPDQSQSIPGSVITLDDGVESPSKCFPDFLSSLILSQTGVNPIAQASLLQLESPTLSSMKHSGLRD